MRLILARVGVMGLLVLAGCVHAQTGPLIGVSTKQGPVIGWEAGVGLGVLSGTVGAEVTPFGERTATFYGAGEPAIAIPVAHDEREGVYPSATFLSGGSTIGYATDDGGETAWMFGGFGGAARLQSGDCAKSTATSVSVIFGVHVFVHDEVEVTIYGSPKIGVVTDCPDFRISFD